MSTLLAVIGHPVAHSRSPVIHAAFAQALGHTVRYERLDAPPGQFATVLAAFAARGARGCNVTVPYKFDAHAAAARATPRAALAGAANTLRFDAPAEGGWLADNTDGAGLVHDLTVHAGWPLAGQRLLLLGAGGAAAGVLGALIAARPAALTVANRTAHKAEHLVARHAAHAEAHGVALRAGTDEGQWDGIVNATASSLHGAALPLAAARLAPGGWAVDLMYGPASAPFLAWARAQDAQARDGLGMLVAQAAESYALWLGARPETAPVLTALRREVDAC